MGVLDFTKSFWHSITPFSAVMPDHRFEKNKTCSHLHFSLWYTIPRMEFLISNIHSGRALFTNQVFGNALSNSYIINSVLSKDCRMYIPQRLRITYHSESHQIPILVLFSNSLTRTQDRKLNIYGKWLLFFKLCHSLNQSFIKNVSFAHDNMGQHPLQGNKSIICTR